jgi:hypothetical protein
MRNLGRIVSEAHGSMVVFSPMPNASPPPMSA